MSQILFSSVLYSFASRPVVSDSLDAASPFAILEFQILQKGQGYLLPGSIGVSPCWDSEFQTNAYRCCVLGDSGCWMGPFTDQNCCVPPSASSCFESRFQEYMCCDIRTYSSLSTPCFEQAENMERCCGVSTHPRSLFVRRGVVDIATSTVKTAFSQPSKRVSIDDVLYGYDVLFEFAVPWKKQTWKGMLMQQDPSDAFAIQQFLWKERPDTMIEFGTDTGGAAVYFAEIMTAYNPNAHVVTMDISDNINQSWSGEIPEVKASESPLWGKSVHHLVGSPQDLRNAVDALLAQWSSKSVFLNEDASHDAKTVLANLEAYHDLVSPCGWILIQDTKMDRMRDFHGPYAAQKAFLASHTEFEMDRTYEHYLYTQHAKGWLKKRC